MAKKKAIANPKPTPEEKDRARRMKWWHEARFGMFIHWGVYTQLGRLAWAMNRERIPVAEYEPVADTWHPKPGAPKEWAKTAVKAGMKYMVLTTKHHEGFCLWDTKQTDFNAVKRGPGRDLVAEYVDACRSAGLRVGFYYSLLDWHHPDGSRCHKNEAARRRFVDFTHGCVRELCSNYGKIDILWYDVSAPLPTAEAWESVKMNAMVRKLQPDIIINDRAQTPEDFGTPEGKIEAAKADRAWEACMTFTGAWADSPTIFDEDWNSVRDIVKMLQKVTCGGGNLLLNIGPTPEGDVPPKAVEHLTIVGKWLKKYGEAVYGRVDRAYPRLEDFTNFGVWTLKGKTAYLWLLFWPDKTFAIGGLRGSLKRASLLPDGKPLKIEKKGERTIISGLPDRCPDRLAKMAVVKMEFASKPEQVIGPLAVPERGWK